MRGRLGILKRRTGTAGRRKPSTSPDDNFGACAEIPLPERGRLMVTHNGGMIITGMSMTIAACYLSPEGVVFGADSTTTYPGMQGTNHYFNQAQKLFEVGENSSLGIVTWGLGGLGDESHRMLIAKLADELSLSPASSVTEVASRWASLFWSSYFSANAIKRCAALSAKKPFDSNAASSTDDTRTSAEEQELCLLRDNLVVGFCIGGYMPGDRVPAAFQVICDPSGSQPSPTPLPMGYRFWGAPNFIKRLLFGCDEQLRSAILESNHWSGTPQDLDGLIQQYELFHHPTVPIRDAIDFAHACI
jgi:hypothetical protein